MHGAGDHLCDTLGKHTGKRLAVRCEVLLLGEVGWWVGGSMGQPRVLSLDVNNQPHVLSLNSKNVLASNISLPTRLSCVIVACSFIRRMKVLNAGIGPTRTPPKAIGGTYL